MAGEYTVVRHPELAGMTGYIYQDENGGVFAGVKDDAAATVDWEPAADVAEATRMIADALNEVVRQLKIAQQQPPLPPQQASYPQGYPQQQGYQQPYPQGYPHQQYAPQPYQPTPAEQRRAEKKARNKALRQEIWEEFKDEMRESNARRQLERDCLKYPCPECPAPSRVRCMSIHGRNTLPAPHMSRIEQYQRQRGRW